MRCMPGRSAKTYPCARAETKSGSRLSQLLADFSGASGFRRHAFPRRPGELCSWCRGPASLQPFLLFGAVMSELGKRSRLQLGIFAKSSKSRVYRRPGAPQPRSSSARHHHRSGASGVPYFDNFDPSIYFGELCQRMCARMERWKTAGTVKSPLDASPSPPSSLETARPTGTMDSVRRRRPQPQVCRKRAVETVVGDAQCTWHPRSLFLRDRSSLVDDLTGTLDEKRPAPGQLSPVQISPLVASREESFALPLCSAKFVLDRGAPVAGTKFHALLRRGPPVGRTRQTTTRGQSKDEVQFELGLLPYSR